MNELIYFDRKKFKQGVDDALSMKALRTALSDVSNGFKNAPKVSVSKVTTLKKTDEQKSSFSKR